MAEGTLLLSPHADDMAMAACGIVSRKLLPEPVRLLTVFSWTNYIVRSPRAFTSFRFILDLLPRPQELARSFARNVNRIGDSPLAVLPELLDLNEPYKVSRIRVSEDIRFSRMMGIRYSHLDLPDSNCRRGTPVKDPKSPITNEQPTLEVLCSALMKAVPRARVETIVAPWPFGYRQHIDHRLVSEAAARIAKDLGVKLIYVDDLPYGRRPLGTWPDGRGRPYSSVLVKLGPSEMSMKHKAMDCYRSQMVPGYLEAVSKPPLGSPELENSETLWRPQ